MGHDFPILIYVFDNLDFSFFFYYFALKGPVSGNWTLILSSPSNIMSSIYKGMIQMLLKKLTIKHCRTTTSLKYFVNYNFIH